MNFYQYMIGVACICGTLATVHQKAVSALLWALFIPVLIYLWWKET